VPADGSSGVVRDTSIKLGVSVLFAVAIYWAVLQTLNGLYGLEILVVLTSGLVGGGLVRSFVRDRHVMLVFTVLAVVESVLLSQFPRPWSGLWLVLVLANALGLMVGDIARQGIRAAKPKRPDVWMINGVEEPRTDRAKTKSLAALTSWNSAESGKFFVERNDAVFEAMGDPATGFIVHCAASCQETSQWRILGSLDGKDESEIRIPSGPAFAPSGVVVDLETAQGALLGFFHHRGPDPELTWALGGQVLDLKFG
jgi:hypothetical protein